MWLIAFCDEHPDAVRYDAMAMGRRLSDRGTEAFTWGELRALVSQAPAGSAIGRIRRDAAHTVDVELLRLVEHRLRLLDWRLVSLFKRGVRQPAELRFPWEEPADEAIVGDVMTIEEAEEFLAPNAH